MISKKLAVDLINQATETGADFAEIFYEDTFNKSYSFEGLKVQNVVSSNVNGVGIRLLKENQCVYGYTNDLSKSSLTKLVDNLSKSFNSGRVVEKITGFKNQTYKKINKKVTPLLSVEPKEIINYVKSGVEIILNYDKRIVRVVSGFSIVSSNYVILNSEGKSFKKSNEYGRVYLNSIASENGKIETRFDGPGSQKGWDFFVKDLDFKTLALENAKKVILMLGAKECPSGHFPVVIGNGWGGVIFHEACGHQLEATSVAKGLSVFTGMKGKQIANTIVSAYDDGTMPNEWGSNDIDDEGNPTQNNCLIKDGILVGYLVDDFNGRRMGEKGNGASRRESYKYAPTSRMSNTYIAKGKSTPEEIIKNTKLGLYAVSFNGGSVNPAVGDFNFGCSEAYIIKDGKILEPVRGATLVGNAKDILKHIDMVGNDVGLGQGMCGSASGSIPVNVGQPTIRVDDITVGGRGGSIDEYK